VTTVPPEDGIAADPSLGPAEPPAWAPYTLVAFVALVVCSWVGTAFSTKWANTNPELLLLASSRVRHLLLVAGQMPWWSYAAIAAFRLALAFVVCHLVGRAYERQVLVWFGKYLGVTADQIHKTMGMFHRAEWFVIPFFAGSNIVAAISGISRVSFRRLAVLLTIGLAVRLVFWWVVAKLADDEIDAVLDFLAKYQTPALILSVVATIVVIGFNLRRGRNFQL